MTAIASEFRFREYRPADLESLWRLDQRCFTPEIAYSRRELEYYLRNRTKICIVAEAAEKLAGFILGHRDARGFGHIVTIDVDADFRRSGLGSQLIARLEDRFRAAGCGNAVLEVAVDNRAALDFYKKHGYTTMKTLPRYYPGGLDGLLMGKRLAFS
jgi:ribosomal-protein-alanine N-acetyltransferase